MEDVITIQVVIDPAWVGSMTPYRVICNGRSVGPMTGGSVARQVESATERAIRDSEWRRSKR